MNTKSWQLREFDSNARRRHSHRFDATLVPPVPAALPESAVTAAVRIRDRRAGEQRDVRANSSQLPLGACKYAIPGPSLIVSAR